MNDSADGWESDEDEREMMPGSDLLLLIVISSPFLVRFELFGIEGWGEGNAVAWYRRAVVVVAVRGGVIGGAGGGARIRSG